MSVIDVQMNLHLAEQQFPLHSLARKKSGSEWKGKVVGYYSTELTPIGIAVESGTEKGSVQIYPVKALERVSPDSDGSRNGGDATGGSIHDSAGLKGIGQKPSAHTAEGE